MVRGEKHSGLSVVVLKNTPQRQASLSALVLVVGAQISSTYYVSKGLYRRELVEVKLIMMTHSGASKTTHFDWKETQSVINQKPREC